MTEFNGNSLFERSEKSRVQALALHLPFYVHFMRLRIFSCLARTVSLSNPIYYSQYTHIIVFTGLIFELKDGIEGKCFEYVIFGRLKMQNFIELLFQILCNMIIY